MDLTLHGGIVMLKQERAFPAATKLEAQNHLEGHYMLGAGSVLLAYAKPRLVSRTTRW